MYPRTILLALMLATPLSLPLAAQAQAQTASAPATGALPLTQGEIKKVDKEAGKLTIKHGPITNLDMPGMTMLFRVKDPAMLDQVKPGDKVRFVVERANGTLMVTVLEAAK